MLMLSRMYCAFTMLLVTVWSIYILNYESYRDSGPEILGFYAVTFLDFYIWLKMSINILNNYKGCMMWKEGTYSYIFSSRETLLTMNFVFINDDFLVLRIVMKLNFIVSNSIFWNKNDFRENVRFFWIFNFQNKLFHPVTKWIESNWELIMWRMGDIEEIEKCESNTLVTSGGTTLGFWETKIFRNILRMLILKCDSLFFTDYNFFSNDVQAGAIKKWKKN